MRCIYSCAICVSSPSVSLSSGWGLSEIWMTGFSVRICLGIRFSKSANICATSTLPSPLLNTLFVSNNWPFPMFTLLALYLMAPKRELPIVIFATISPLPPLPMPRSAVPAPSSGESSTPDDRARPLPSSLRSGCAVPSLPDCS